MGYTLEFSGVDLEALLKIVNEAAATGELSEGVVTALVSASGAAEPVLLDVDDADELVELIQEHSWWWGSLQHTSSGGEEFRGEFDQDLVPLFGAEFVNSLMHRPFANLETEDHPLIGWVDRTEIVAALARLKASSPPSSDDEPESLHILLPILRRAAELNLDIISLYL